MEKKRNPKTLILRKESIRQLASSGLKAVAGGVRIWKPVGLADDTTPLYAWEDDTQG